LAVIIRYVPISVSLSHATSVTIRKSPLLYQFYQNSIFIRVVCKLKVEKANNVVVRGSKLSSK